MNAKLRSIIGQYREICRKDGEVEDYELKKWLSLDEELPDRYKTDAVLEEIIKLINQPEEVERPKNIEELYEEIEALYNQGLSDIKIAEKLGIKYWEVRKWRDEKNLPSNHFKITDYEKVKELYERGLIDTEIAKALDIEYTTVRSWRINNKLLSNSEIKKQKREKLYWKYYNQGLSDGQIKEKAGGAKGTIYNWRVKNNLPANIKQVGGRKKNDND